MPFAAAHNSIRWTPEARCKFDFQNLASQRYCPHGVIAFIISQEKNNHPVWRVQQKAFCFFPPFALLWPTPQLLALRHDVLEEAVDFVIAWIAHLRPPPRNQWKQHLLLPLPAQGGHDKVGSFFKDWQSAKQWWSNQSQRHPLFHRPQELPRQLLLQRLPPPTTSSRSQGPRFCVVSLARLPKGRHSFENRPSTSLMSTPPRGLK